MLWDKVKQKFKELFHLIISFTGTSHNSQDVEEDVDDVSVEVECGKNVFLWTQR